MTLKETFSVNNNDKGTWPSVCILRDGSENLLKHEAAAAATSSAPPSDNIQGNVNSGPSFGFVLFCFIIVIIIIQHIAY